MADELADAHVFQARVSALNQNTDTQVQVSQAKLSVLRQNPDADIQVSQAKLSVMVGDFPNPPPTRRLFQTRVSVLSVPEQVKAQTFQANISVLQGNPKTGPGAVYQARASVLGQSQEAQVQVSQAKLSILSIPYPNRIMLWDGVREQRMRAFSWDGELVQELEWTPHPYVWNGSEWVIPE